MAYVSALVCDGCGVIIPPAKAGEGDLQGGPFKLVLPHITVEFALCRDCRLKPWKFQKLQQIGTTRAGGAAVGPEQLAYLPVDD